MVVHRRFNAQRLVEVENLDGAGIAAEEVVFKFGRMFRKAIKNMRILLGFDRDGRYLCLRRRTAVAYSAIHSAAEFFG